MDYYLPDEDEQEMLKMEEISFDDDDDTLENSSNSDESGKYMQFHYLKIPIQ